MNEQIEDTSGQVKTLLVSTQNGAADYGIKSIPATEEALRKAIPPTPLSQRGGDDGGVHRRGSDKPYEPRSAE